VSRHAVIPRAGPGSVCAANDVPGELFPIGAVPGRAFAHRPPRPNDVTRDRHRRRERSRMRQHLQRWWRMDEALVTSERSTADGSPEIAARSSSCQPVETRRRNATLAACLPLQRELAFGSDP
jgi:hypothetical protein